MLQALLDSIAQNPQHAVLVAFVVAAAEAILLIGLFVPSTVVLVGLGGLIGMGKLPFWAIFWATALGAIVGDALSFWLGHHYRQHLYAIWPFSRYQSLLVQGQAYFQAHGGKSVVIGRFIPGVKAVVPSIAGMMAMPVWRFSVLNVLSALVWAAAHLLPGLSAGVLLLGLGAISQRLAISVGILLVTTLLLVWLGKRVLLWSIGELSRLHQALQHWATTYSGRGSGLLKPLLASEYATVREQSLLSLLWLGSLLGLAFLLEDWVGQQSIPLFDHSMQHTLQALHTPWTDGLLLAATLSGDAPVLGSVIAVVLLVLASQRHWRLLAGVAVLILSAVLFVNGMKWWVHSTRPLADLYSGVSAYAFPSGHATLSFTLVVLLSWLSWQQSHAWLRTVFIILAGLWAVLVAFSRLYLGAHWFSDVAAGWLFGLGAVAVFAQVFAASPLTRRELHTLLLSSSLTLLVVGVGYSYQQWDAAQQRYAARAPSPLTLNNAWAEAGWEQLPQYRLDWAGEAEEPFVLQWQGTPVALQQALAGWTPAVPWSLASLNAFVGANSTATALPVLPKLHEGHAEAYAWVKAAQLEGQNGRYVLRLYPQAVLEQGKPTTLWLGSLSFEVLYHPFGQLSLTWHPEETLACDATAILAALPTARITTTWLGLQDDHYACHGYLVLAGQ